MEFLPKNKTKPGSVSDAERVRVQVEKGKSREEKVPRVKVNKYEKERPVNRINLG